MEFDPKRVEANARAASTEDLLDRVTVFRDGMEPEALPILKAELRARGVSEEAIRAHEEQRFGAGVIEAKGLAARCCQCFRPAVARVMHWHRLWGRLPVFPMLDYFCEEHRPKKPGQSPGTHVPDEQSLE